MSAREFAARLEKLGAVGISFAEWAEQFGERYDGPVLIGNFKGIDVEPADRVPGLYDLHCTACGDSPRDLTTGQTRSYLGRHPETCLPLRVRNDAGDGRPAPR